MLKTIAFTLAASLPLLCHAAPFDISNIPDADKGLSIATEADKRDTGFVSTESNMKMTLRNRRGDESIRQLRSRVLEVENDGDKSLTIFDDPADVAGTAALTYTHGLEPDDQWLYLPALKRVKRISSKNKSGPFMGSEFAFEDIGSQAIEKYSYEYLREETCGDLNCFVIKLTPLYKFSGYTRQIAWVDTEELRTVKVEFYDRKNALLKTLESSEYQQYLGQYWRPGKLDMQNHQTKKSTTLQFSDYKFQTGLTPRDFDKNALKSIR